MKIKRQIPNYYGYIMVVVAAAFWASLGVIARFIYAHEIDTFTLVTGRSLFSFILIAVFLLITNRDAIKIETNHIPKFMFFGIFGLASNFFCFLVAIKYTTVATASILLFTYPAIVCFVSAIIFKETLDRDKILALILTAIGCFFAIGGHAPKALNLNARGVLWGLGTALSMVVYTIYGNTLLKTYSSYTLCFWGFLFSALTFIVMRPMSIVYLFTSSAYSIFMIFIAALIPTFLAYTLYIVAVDLIGPSKASIMGNLEPVLAAVYSFVFLNETLTILQWVGILIVVFAVCLLSIKSQRTEPSRLETPSEVSEKMC